MISFGRHNETPATAYSCCGASHPVVGVAQLVLGDTGFAVVGHENQLLFKYRGAKLPARGQPQSRTELLQIVELLFGSLIRLADFMTHELPWGSSRDVRESPS